MFLFSQFIFFFFNDTATTEIYTLSLHDALPISMSEMQARVDELLPHAEDHVVVYCHHGMRSLQVTQWLLSQDFKQCQSMAGGIDAWSSDIDDSLPRYG